VRPQQAPAAPAALASAEAAAPAPTAASPGPPATGPSSAWVGALDAWIDAHLDYPEDSRRRGEQGAVLVRLTVAHDGRLLDFALLRSSGYDELDDATRAMFRHARLPAAPLDSDPPQATLSKPVRYLLR
jgi:protein TonB